MLAWAALFFYFYAMAKTREVFICSACGAQTLQWRGQCPGCHEWNTLQAAAQPKALSRSNTRVSAPAGNRPVPLQDVAETGHHPYPSGIASLDRVLGKGLVPGAAILIGGEPGIGKSTIIMQTAANIARRGSTVLYVSGEESEEQIKLRADRVCREIPQTLYVLAETNMENVELACENCKPDFLIIDSIQTMYSNQLDSAPGSVSQVRMCGNQLMKLGKTKNLPIFIVAHVTKSGDLAGPKTVEHLVDCVLNFTGERDQELRVMRAYKNRFGTTSEIGAFRMEAEGLIEVRDISASFLENREDKTQGSVTTAIYEGSRPVMFEMQALVSPANVGFARRTAVGVDNTRLNMILAVLEKIVGMPLGNQDVYVNVVGGIRPEGTGADLAAALAIYSSFKNITARKRTLAMGEIGLTGDLRSVQNAEKIIKEAARLGYEQVILPKRNAQKVGGSLDGCRVIGVKNIQEAIRVFSM